MFGWRGDEVERAKLAETYDIAATSIIIFGGRDIGWMAVQRRRDHIELEHLYLEPSHQSRGIGSAILRSLIAEGDACRLPLRLATAKMNPARRLYERLGFIEVDADDFKVYLERAVTRASET